MKYNFCTLFDKNYLYRGLTLYNSLLKTCPDFHLWILCMDTETHTVLTKLNLKKATLITLSKFEDTELLKIKSTRNSVEYCWTCSSSLPLYILKNNLNLETICYLDADLFFYSSPEPIYQELGQNSILIVKHRYSPKYAKNQEKCGVFNVSMIIWRNDEISLSCLKEWREQCLNWCFARYEDGKFGDQLYLNNWPQKYTKLHILRHKGANVAPWNINNYQIKKETHCIFVDQDVLIFYHFHTLKIFDFNKFYLSSYPLTSEQKKIIYKPYLEALQNSISQVEKACPDFQGFDHDSLNLKLQRTLNPLKQFIKYYLRI